MSMFWFIELYPKKQLRDRKSLSSCHFSYPMSNRSWPILYGKLQYKMGQDPRHISISMVKTSLTYNTLTCSTNLRSRRHRVLYCLLWRRRVLYRDRGVRARILVRRDGEHPEPCSTYQIVTQNTLRTFEENSCD